MDDRTRDIRRPYSPTSVKGSDQERVAELEREVEALERTLALKSSGAEAVMARQAHELMEQMIPVVRAAVKWRTCHNRDENEKDWLHTLFVVTGEYLDDQEAPTSLDELRKRVPVQEGDDG